MMKKRCDWIFRLILILLCGAPSLDNAMAQDGSQVPVYIKSVKNNLYVNVLGGTHENGQFIVLGDHPSAENYHWLKIPAGDGYYFLKNKRTRKCLNAADNQMGSYLVQGPCEGVLSQWRMHQETLTRQSIISKHWNETCLAVPFWSDEVPGSKLIQDGGDASCGVSQRYLWVVNYVTFL